MKRRADFRDEREKGFPCFFSRVCPSAFVCVASLGIWLPRSEGATLVDLDATSLPTGPLNTWTNAGTIGQTFVVPTNAVVPSVTNVDGVHAVAFQAGGGSTGGTHYVGPEVPASVTGPGVRTIEAWIFDPTRAAGKTIFAWGRDTLDGLGFSLGHGTNLNFGAVQCWGSPDIGWNNQQTFGIWTHIAATYDGATLNVYSDGQLANSKFTFLDTAQFASDGTNVLHFRIARQNSGTGAVNPVDVGPFFLGRVRIYDELLDDATILAHFNAEKGSFNLNDTDGDGIPDWYEERCGLNKYVNDAALDKDGDGLTNLQEYLLGTRADIADTDGDGISDGDEVNRVNPLTGLPEPTNPLDRDTDHDGLPDGVETGTGVFICASDPGTNPTTADSDGDGDLDQQEITNETDPTDPNSFCHCSISDLPQLPCPVVNLDAAKLPLGPLTAWTNKGTTGGSFIAPTNAALPTVTTVDGVRAVSFEASGGAAGGTQLIGPEVPPVSFAPYHAVILTTNGDRMVEAWIRDSAPQFEKTIFAWGRRGGFAPEGKNFAIGHGTNATSGGLSTGSSADLGFADQEVFGRWTYAVVTSSTVVVGSGTNAWLTNVISAYVDGRPASSQTNTLNTAAFAADAPNSSTDSTNRLHFRIGRQNTDTGDVDGNGIGAFHLAKLRVYDFVWSAASILHRFQNERMQFLPPLRIDQVSVNSTNGEVLLSWAAGPGRPVSIETSTDLATWSLIASNLTGTRFTDSMTNLVLGTKFYRLRVP
jgi:hypothetical protein